MSEAENIQKKLEELLQLPRETEWVEFKEAKNNFDFDDLGRYFSALSNEANLKGQSAGWLVFGVSDPLPRQVVGSSYRRHPPGLEKLSHEIAKHTNHAMTFRSVHEDFSDSKRVVMFEIPPAVRGIPTTWNGVPYGRIHETMGYLALDKIEQIRRQAAFEDWSAEACRDATLNDLNPNAVAFAKQQYKKKNPNLALEVERWDDQTFLYKTKVCVAGGVTRAAIILLGKPEAVHFLSPAAARISWVLRDEHGQERDYEHFTPPIILAVDKVFARVRNNIYRYMPNATLFPVEISQYDPWVIREVLHNCIAHQDYTKGGHINVVEEVDSLLFSNLGDFLPGSVEEVIRRDSPPELYRNRLLAEAMVGFNLIDTIGGGIKRMFRRQRERYFPLPDYDLREEGGVKVRVLGKVLDERYTRLLIEKTDLDLWEVIALDKVQKGKSLSDEEFRLLKTKRLIEGRRPRLYVASKIAAAMETKIDYIKKRAFDKQHFMKMVQQYLQEFDTASREDFDRLLMNKISDALSQEQKRNFITNLLQEMRRKSIIRPVMGKRGKGARWELYKSLSQS